MKVKDAIKELQQLDPEMEIMVCDDTIEFGTYSPLDGFEIVDFYKDRTPMSIVESQSYFEVVTESDKKRNNLEKKIAVRF